MTFRTRSLKAAAALALSSALAFSACSKDDAKSTDAATTEAPAETSAATDAPAETAEATEALAATEAESTAAATEAPDTVAATASEAAAAGSELSGLMVTQMLSGMTGGATPDPADVKCVTDKVDEKALAAVIEGATSGATPDTNAMLPILKGVFQCKPKGLIDSFAKDSLGDLTEVSADEKKCIGNAVLDAIATSDSILKAMVADASAPPAEFKDAARKAATDCVKDEGVRAKVIAELDKN